MNYIIVVICVVILIYDGYLAVKDHTTISQWCQKLFPPAVDWGIGVAGWVLLCFIKKWFPEFDFTLAVFIAGFWGHIWIANKERYGRD